MKGGFQVLSDKTVKMRETWTPIVKARRAKVLNEYTSLILELVEPNSLKRRMDVEVRAYNEGVAFRIKLFRNGAIDDRKITRELTSFSIPGNPKAWVAEYRGYASHQEGEFFEHNLSYLTATSIAGLPLRMEYATTAGWRQV